MLFRSSHGKPVAQGTGAHVYALDGAHVRVNRKGRIQLVEGAEELHGEVAPLRQHCAQGGAGVSLGEDEAVALLPAGPGRVDLQDLEV